MFNHLLEKSSDPTAWVFVHGGDDCGPVAPPWPMPCAAERRVWPANRGSGNRQIPPRFRRRSSIPPAGTSARSSSVLPTWRELRAPDRKERIRQIACPRKLIAARLLRNDRAWRPGGVAGVAATHRSKNAPPILRPHPARSASEKR